MTTESIWSLDTNVLVYATGLDSPPQKKQVAIKLLEELFVSHHACLAGQVLGEYLSVVIRKRLMPHLLALETVNVWSKVARVLPAPTQVYEQAWQLTVKHHYQVWDALIIAICAEHGVKTLYSEDAGSLKRPLGVHVINPFSEIEIS